MTRPRVEIEYCSQCGFLLRSAWMAQELLTTFVDELGGVTLIPARAASSRCASTANWSGRANRKVAYPDPKELKQRVRDIIAPEKDLGHSDRK